MGPTCVGQGVPRKEGEAKVAGRAAYVDDLRLPGMLHGVTVRSTAARGRILAVGFGDGIPWDELVVVTARDVPGVNHVTLLDTDQPCLADGVVNHWDEPVVLLAHADRHLLEEARRRVHVEVEPLPAVLTIEDSLECRTVVWGKDNVFADYRVERGDPDGARRAAVHVVVGVYRTGAQEQLYIETQGVIAVPEPEGGISVHGSMQCPYYVQKALGPILGLPPERVRVVQTVTGGGFGGKEEYPSMIAAHAALLARKARRPVKLVYDREEDIQATTKRHPSRTWHRTAVDAEGRLLAMEVDFVIDGGAYKTLSPVVLSRGLIHSTGPYRCENVRLRGRAVATSAPPHGAFRGFGAPQSIFAVERHLDRVARDLGLDPVELRRRNFLHRGDRTAVGQEVREEPDMEGLMEKALEESDYRARRVACRRARERPGETVRRGVGLAAFYHGSGFTGSGEVHLASVASLECGPEGRVEVQASSTEIGQGTSTILAQITAGALGVDYRLVEVAPPDTDRVPDSGPTVASRTCMVVGRLVERCAGQALEVLRAEGLLPGGGHDDAQFVEACRVWCARHGPLRTHARYEPPPGIRWDPERFQGDAYGAYSWAVYVARVAVDTLTWETRVEDLVAVQEVGRAVHPLLAAGQVEGGVAQGVGFALYEKVVWRGGRVANARMTDYVMPTSEDAPPIRVHFVERPYAHGPSGAKGLGELPMDGPAPAIIAAVEDATGAALDSVPLLPEDLMVAMEGVIESR
ncbi:MAG: xanthine dehydrogenase family protein [Planctomycetes bacterium]|nr:xanthine dehydrogenase family protein [Planctomycetota bacterium]